MKWTEDYATGIPHIDEQHRQIFATADDFRIALEEGGGEKSYPLVLEFLYRYVRAHFGYEDRCMTEYHCPAAQLNREAHAVFTKSLEGYRERYASAGYQPEDARELMDYLERWFIGHIGTIDVTLREFSIESTSK
jgi:hemerythrin